jgi:PAS domain S-box-containing protein
MPDSEQTASFPRIFDALPVAVIMVNLKGSIQYMNRMAMEILGEPNKRLKLEDWPKQFGLYLDDGRLLYPAEKLPLVRALKGEGVEEPEEVLLRRSEDVPGTWLSLSTEVLRDDQGNITGGLAILRDITYRKQIENSRERQMKRIEALYRLSHIIAEAGNSLDETIRLASSFPAEEIGGMSVLTLLTDTKNDLKIASFHDADPTRQALLRKHLILETEYPLSDGLEGEVMKSGEPLLIPSISPEQLQAMSLPLFREVIAEVGIKSVLIVPLVGRTGVLGAIHLYRYKDAKPFSTGDQSFLTDISHRLGLAVENCRLFESLREEITRHLSTKQALAISEERFRSIFESVTLGIKVLDLDGIILQTNSSFREMLGCGEEEMAGKPFYDFVHPEDSVRAAMLFQDVKNKGVSSFRFEHRILSKDNSIVWAKTFFTVVRRSEEAKEVVLVVGIVENITEQKRRELEMAELKERLQNSMELERLRLAQELHDNPMQTLYSASYTLQELRSKADPKTAETLNKIKDMIQDVLHSLRATSKELRPPTLSSFGLENAIRSHAQDFQEQHPHIKVHLSLAHDRQMLPDNVRLALFRVLQQALVNVIRHAEATEVHIRFLFDAEEVQLEVSDNGKGFQVPNTWIDLVRQEHYGLAGAAERVSAIGGVLNVESQPGSSTTVRATIPLDTIES